MTRKEGNEARVMAAIASLTRPEGATALYDAVYNVGATDAGIYSFSTITYFLLF